MSAITRRHSDGRLADAAHSSAGGLRASAGTQPNDGETVITAIQDRLKFITQVPFGLRSGPAGQLHQRKKPTTDPIAAAATGAVVGEGLASSFRAGRTGRRSHPRRGALSA